MAVFIQAELRGVTADQYDALTAKLQALPGDVFEGCLAHVAVQTESGFEVFDLWESEAAMEKFAQAMMPVAAEAGISERGGRPKIMQVHSYWVPGT
ncbi:hypothetical protein [Streptomyces sp. NPDC051219]|uniref:hypothetical protein n=1 Tax=Streptomyces sp. NPDC051219 TaxID=3155283 RepID=UPI00341DF475